MPVYEYQCQDCGARFELRQKFSDSPLSCCSTCGGEAKRVISLTGFALKGGGWYQQGYNNTAPKTENCPAAAGSASGDSCSGCPKAANG